MILFIIFNEDVFVLVASRFCHTLCTTVYLLYLFEINYLKT